MEEKFTLYKNENVEERDPNVFSLFDDDELELVVEGDAKDVFKLIDECYPVFEHIPPENRERELFLMCPELTEEVASFILDCFAEKERRKMRILTEEEIAKEEKQKQIYEKQLEDEIFQ